MPRHCRTAWLVVLLLLSDTRPAVAGCVGDCNGNGAVSIDELIQGVNIALGGVALDACPAFETNGNGRVTIDEILRGVTGALSGCDTPMPTPTATPPAAPSIEIEPRGVLLTGPGESRVLMALVLDGDGQPIQDEVSWTSSDPAIVSVDETGTVRAGGAIGTARITASVGAVQSEPAYVYVAAPVAGALLLNDDQIVSGPTIADPDAEPMFDSPYEVVLRGVPSLEPGTILINTEELAVAGRVVSATPDGEDLRVQVVAVPADELFTEVEFKDVVDLSQGPFEIPEELIEAYDIEHRGSTIVFTPKPTTEAILASQVFAPRGRGPQGRGPQGTTALPPLPPFKECTASAGFGSDLPVPLSLSTPPSFEVTINGTLERDFTSQRQTILVRGEPKFTLNSVLEIESAFEAKIECQLTLARRKVRVPGWAGLLFGGDIEFGVGFEAGGKVTLVSAKVGGTAELATTIEAGLTCPSGGDCAVTGTVTADTEVEPTLEAPSLDQAQFEPSVSLFGFIAGELGNADVEQLQFSALEAKAGAELGANLTLEALQIDNTDADDGRSKYALALKGEVGPGINLGEFLSYLGLSEVVPLKLSFEIPLGGSPTGVVTADRARYLPGEPVVVQVKLTPASTLFPAGVGIFNVNRVVVLRKSGLLSTEVLATQTPSGSQTDFTLAFSSPGIVDANELFAFVVTKVLPLDPPKLEIGAATAAGGELELSGADGITMGFCSIRNLRATVSGVTNPSFTFSTDGGGTFGTPFTAGNQVSIEFRSGRTEGTFEITATSGSDQAKNRLTIDAAIGFWVSEGTNFVALAFRPDDCSECGPGDYRAEFSESNYRCTGGSSAPSCTKFAGLGPDAFTAIRSNDTFTLEIPGNPTPFRVTRRCDF